jgi:hypothetical protein
MDLIPDSVKDPDRIGPPGSGSVVICPDSDPSLFSTYGTAYTSKQLFIFKSVIKEWRLSACG